MATPSELTGKRSGISMPLARISTISEEVGTTNEEAMEKEREKYEKRPKYVNSDMEIVNPKLNPEHL